MSPDASMSSIPAVRSPTPTALGPGQRVGEPFEKTPKVANERPLSDAERRPELAEAMTRLNDAVQAVRRQLQFRIDAQSGRTVITVIDRETNEIIRQIPPEEMLDIIHHLEQAGGLIVRDQA